jgi:hypothetical protein
VEVQIKEIEPGLSDAKRLLYHAYRGDVRGQMVNDKYGARMPSDRGRHPPNGLIQHIANVSSYSRFTHHVAHNARHTCSRRQELIFHCTFMH